jgi:hypothetical protein
MTEPPTGHEAMLPAVECYGCGARAPAPDSPEADAWYAILYEGVAYDGAEYYRLVCPECLEDPERAGDRLEAWDEVGVHDAMGTDDPETSILWVDGHARVVADLTGEELDRWYEERRAVWAELAQSAVQTAWMARHDGQDESAAQRHELVARKLVELMTALDELDEDDEGDARRD